MTTPVITAYNWSPDRGRGLVRDMRVRWALEEVGQPYDVRYLSWGEQKEPAHRARNPFGQVPAYEEGDLVLFESGAIIFHIAENGSRLFPEDPAGRARAIEWMFAALNSVEPVVWDLIIAKIIEGGEDWAAARLPVAEARLSSRLEELSVRLGDSNWLDGEFSAGDLLMVSVLRPIEGSAAIAKFPNLEAYVARGVARPAFKRAFEQWKAGQTGETPATFTQLEPQPQPEGEAA